MANTRSAYLTPAFKKAFASLNPAQKQAVTTIEGPVMVIAGPGTGKTQIIATRIANILARTDTEPSAILALTFTDSGSVAMRQRLVNLVGPAGYRVNVSTFHSFATEIIQTYPEYFIYSRSTQPLTDLERHQIITHLIDTHDLNQLKPVNVPHYYVSAIISSIQALKREAISPARLHSSLKKDLKLLAQNKDRLSKTEFNLRQKNLGKNLELLKIYQSYQASLTGKGRYDFEDMINWVITALKQNEDLLTLLQERFHYFLADEYQDTNSAQNEILSLLTSYWGDQANLFVVLDDEQSIYRFQGASLENALNFKKNYPSAQTITLSNNYRSQQTILDAARSVISNNRTNLQNTFPGINRHLISQVKIPQKKLNLIKTAHPLFEYFYLQQAVARLIASGTPPSEIAIIARHNADLLPVSDFLTRHRLKNHILGSQDTLHAPVVKYLIKLLQVLYQSRTAVDDLDLFTLLHYPFLDLPPMDILILSRLASQHKLTLIEVINSPQYHSSLHSPQKFIRFVNHLASWNQLENSKTFIEFLQCLIGQSSLLNWVLSQPDSNQHLRHLHTFFEMAKQLNANDHQLNLHSFINHLDLMVQHNIPLSTPEIDLASDSIVLTTAHKAKGLEWSHVFIINCIDGKWGNQTTRELINLPLSLLKHQKNPTPLHHLEDERRLFYVTLTRAKTSITITFSAIKSSSSKTQALPSQFVQELPPTLISSRKFKPATSRLNHLLGDLLTPPPPPSLAEKTLLTSILEHFRLSATALDTYLECPYKFKLNHLLRIPRAKKPHLSFGTAIHRSLEHFYRHFQTTKQLPGKKFLLANFTRALRQEIMTKNDYTARLSQGKRILSAYYDLHQDQFSPPLFVEKYFGYSSSPITLGDIPLAGKIDRIDLLNPQSKTALIVDYKTGKKKTRGQIEGSTQDSTGSYKRQLVFYQLLADLDPTFPYQIVQSELDFVQSPAQDGRSGRESFRLTSTDLNELKKLIRASIRQIRALKFPCTNDRSVCLRCEFKDHCWPHGISQHNQEQLSFLKTTAENSPAT